MSRNNLISIHAVIAKTVSNFGLRQIDDLPYQDMMLWATEALAHIGSRLALETKRVQVKIENYRGMFPRDLEHILRVENYPNFKSHNHFFEIDLKEGEVFIEYAAMPMDEEGPLFPGDVSTGEAVSWYIAYRLSLQGRLPGNIDPRYCDSQWQWYCGQARAEGFTPTIDEMNRIANVFTRLIVDPREYAYNFDGLKYSTDFGGRSKN